MRPLLLPLLCLPLLATEARAASDVLWYTGNGGSSSTSTTSLQAAVEADGSTFSTASTMPTDLTDYDLVFLVESTRLYSSVAISTLQTYLDGGGVLVLVVDGSTGTSSSSVNNLNSVASELGAETQFVADNLDAGCSETATPAASSPLAECIDDLQYAGSADMTVGSAATVDFTGASSQTLVATEGNLIFIADTEILLDTCTLSEGNTTFFSELLAGVLEDTVDGDCDGGVAASAGGDDCDDDDPEIYTGATDLCDDIDNNCDGQVDEDSSQGDPYYLDEDGDLYGVSSDSVMACDPPEGYADNYRDCDDDDPDTNPSASEVCDDADNDCDGSTDESATDARVYYIDEDGDGYGAEVGAVLDCDQPADTVVQPGDCDDTTARVHEGATEYCNDVDDDCDDVVDEDAVNSDTFYADADGDGYGDPNSTTTACDAPDGYTSDDRDCDDADPTIYPGAPGWSVLCEEQSAGGTDSEKVTDDPGCACAATGAPSAAGLGLLASVGLAVARRRSARAGGPEGPRA